MTQQNRKNFTFVLFIGLITAFFLALGSWFIVRSEVQLRNRLVSEAAQQSLGGIQALTLQLVEYYELDMLHELERSHERGATINYLLVVDVDGGPLFDHRPQAEVDSLCALEPNQEFRMPLGYAGDVNAAIVVGINPEEFQSGLNRAIIQIVGGAALCLILVMTMVAISLRMRTDAAVLEVEIRKEREARELAQTVSRARSEFLANVSHEIRTPMNGIIGIIELMGHSSLSPEQAGFMNDLKSSSGNLLDLLNQVLDAAKIDAGQFKLQPVEFDLAHLLENLRAIFRGKALQKNLALDFSLDESLPHRVRGDSLRSQQILNNLVGNAIKFTETGRIEVHGSPIERDGDRVQIRFTVRDTGIGIPDSDSHDLFDPFTQAEGHSARKHGGTGLGLSICKQIVEMMGGRIQCRNLPTGGSEFEFDITLEVVAETVEPVPVTTVENPWAQDARSGDQAILVAEDNPLNQKVLRLMLEKLGFTPVMAANGRKCLELFARQEFDLVLMDCQMPEMDGYEATRRIRQREGTKAHTPIIAITANAMPGDRELCLQAGMDGFLAKPINGEKLKTLLDQWLHVPAES